MMRSFWDGTPCGKCRQPLKVVVTDPSTTYRLRGDEYIHSVYACSGEEAHRWQDDPLLYQGSVQEFEIVSIEDGDYPTSLA